MVANKWLGVAQPRVAIKAFQPSNVSAGSQWLLRVAGTNYQYTYPASVIGNELTDQDRARVICDGLVAAYSGGGLGGGSTQFIQSLASQLVNGKWSVVATGESSGAPLDVEVTAVEATESRVKILELQAGQAGQNEKQIIKWPKTPTGGTLTVRYKEKAATVVYNVNDDGMAAALEGLSTIGAGNVTVSGSHLLGYTIEFIGDLAGTDVDLLVATSSDAAGTAVAEYEVTQHGGIKRTTYALSALDSDSESVLRFSFDGETSHYFTGAASASQIQGALESIPALSGNVDVNREEDGILILTGAALILEICYYAIRLWREWMKTKGQERPPLLPIEGERFELAPGEAYALSPKERSRFAEEMRAANEY